MDDLISLRTQQRQAVNAEILKRVTVHKRNIARLNSAKVAANNLSVSLQSRPYAFLAQGDSWFDYPLNGDFPTPGGTDVIANLRQMAPGYTILNLAVSGSTAVTEMSLARQEDMITQLTDTSNWLHGKPDAILFSAGGNDIAGEEFLVVLDFNDGRATGLNKERFEGMLASVRACYLDLFAVRDRFAPGVPIFGHCYDFPIPNGSHPLCAGPWLLPSLTFCNWSVAQGTAIVRAALTQFRAMLKTLEADPSHRFHVVETQGLLTAAEWANELHPTPGGFAKVAGKFASVLGASFPASPGTV